MSEQSEQTNATALLCASATRLCEGVAGGRADMCKCLDNIDRAVNVLRDSVEDRIFFFATTTDSGAQIAYWVSSDKTADREKWITTNADKLDGTAGYARRSTFDAMLQQQPCHALLEIIHTSRRGGIHAIEIDPAKLDPLSTLEQFSIWTADAAHVAGYFAAQHQA